MNKIENVEEIRHIRKLKRSSPLGIDSDEDLEVDCSDMIVKLAKDIGLYSLY